MGFWFVIAVKGAGEEVVGLGVGRVSSVIVLPSSSVPGWFSSNTRSKLPFSCFNTRALAGAFFSSMKMKVLFSNSFSTVVFSPEVTKFAISLSFFIFVKAFFTICSRVFVIMARLMESMSTSW